MEIATLSIKSLLRESHKVRVTRGPCKGCPEYYLGPRTILFVDPEPSRLNCTER